LLHSFRRLRVYSGERMSSHGDLRKKLESTNYSDLGEMMEGYARAAAELAKKEFRQNLDFTSESIDALDEILVLVGRARSWTWTSRCGCGAPTWVRCCDGGMPAGGR